MDVVMGEVEDGTDDDEVEGVVFKRHRLDRFAAEIFFGQVCGELANLAYGFGVFIYSTNLVAFMQKIREVAPTTAAGIQDAHGGRNAALEDLIDEIDVCGAEQG